MEKVIVRVHRYAFVGNSSDWEMCAVHEPPLDPLSLIECSNRKQLLVNQILIQVMSPHGIQLRSLDVYGVKAG